MKHYCQLEYSHRINGTSSTMHDYGCYITSLAMLLEIEPPALLRQLEEANCFYGDLLINDAAAETLGLSYTYTKEKPFIICIAETNIVGAGQHFFVYNPADDMMADPLDRTKKWRKNKYNIVSYRVFGGIGKTREVMLGKIRKYAKASKVDGTIDNRERSIILKMIRALGG